MSGSSQEEKGIRCPKCKGSAKVIDSRGVEGGIRRRRECESCGHRWTNYEWQDGFSLTLRIRTKRGKISVEKMENAA